MQTREHKVKVTTSQAFTENQLTNWLDEVATKGWELITCTYFGAGMIWIFQRAIIDGQPEDTEDIDEIVTT